MNKQDFEAQDRFPLSTQALGFMQDMIAATAQLALIGGDNYILSGCETVGNKVSDGVIVINGEVMPFEGGTKVATITIVETKESILANNMTFENARIIRKAKFATGSGENYYNWTNFKPLQTNKQLETAKATVKYVDDEIKKIQADCVPSGMIAMWSGSTNVVPAGWQLCDGSLIAGTSKRTPDLRGRFIVGYNSAVGSGYTRVGSGSKNTDQFMMTLGKDNMPRHNHGMPEYSSGVNPGDYGLIRRSINGEDNSIRNSDAAGSGFEPDIVSSPRSVALKMEGNNKPFDIRPPYYVLAFIIKK